MNKTRRSHNRVVLDCYRELKRSKNPEKVFARYGRKTGEEAHRMIIEEAAEAKGMTIWEYTKWLYENDD